MTQRWQVRRRVQKWETATHYTERVRVCDSRQEAERSAHEHNKRLQRLGRQPVQCCRDEPYKEVYYAQPAPSSMQPRK